MFNEDIHIGKLISAKIKELGINRSELARRINKTRQNIDSIVKRKSLDVDLLISISKELSFNFLNLYINTSSIENEKLKNEYSLNKEIHLLLEKNILLEKMIEDKNRIINLLEKS